MYCVRFIPNVINTYVQWCKIKNPFDISSAKLASHASCRLFIQNIYMGILIITQRKWQINNKYNIESTSNQCLLYF